MERVRGEGAAGELGDDVGASVQRVLFRFDDQQAGAFREDEPIAPEVERPAGGSWIGIALGKGAHVRHGGNGGAAEARLGAPGDDDIGFIALNHLGRLDEGLHSRRAGSRRGNSWAVDAECHRYLTTCHIGSEQGDGQGMNPFGPLRDHRFDIAFHDGNAAAAAVDNGADPLAVFGIDGVAGVLQRFSRRGDREM